MATLAATPKATDAAALDNCFFSNQNNQEKSSTRKKSGCFQQLFGCKAKDCSSSDSLEYRCKKDIDDELSPSPDETCMHYLQSAAYNLETSLNFDPYNRETIKTSKSGKRSNNGKSDQGQSIDTVGDCASPTAYNLMKELAMWRDGECKTKQPNSLLLAASNFRRLPGKSKYVQTANAAAKIQRKHVANFGQQFFSKTPQRCIGIQCTSKEEQRTKTALVEQNSIAECAFQPFIEIPSTDWLESHPTARQPTSHASYLKFQPSNDQGSSLLRKNKGSTSTLQRKYSQDPIKFKLKVSLQNHKFKAKHKLANTTQENVIKKTNREIEDSESDLASAEKDKSLMSTEQLSRISMNKTYDLNSPDDLNSLLEVFQLSREFSRTKSCSSGSQILFAFEPEPDLSEVVKIPIEPKTFSSQTFIIERESANSSKTSSQSNAFTSSLFASELESNLSDSVDLAPELETNLSDSVNVAQKPQTSNNHAFVTCTTEPDFREVDECIEKLQNYSKTHQQISCKKLQRKMKRLHLSTANTDVSLRPKRPVLSVQGFDIDIGPISINNPEEDLLQPTTQSKVEYSYITESEVVCHSKLSCDKEKPLILSPMHQMKSNSSSKASEINSALEIPVPSMHRMKSNSSSKASEMNSILEIPVPSVHRVKSNSSSKASEMNSVVEIPIPSMHQIKSNSSSKASEINPILEIPVPSMHRMKFNSSSKASEMNSILEIPVPSMHRMKFNSSSKASEMNSILEIPVPSMHQMKSNSSSKASGMNSILEMSVPSMHRMKSNSSSKASKMNSILENPAPSSHGSSSDAVDWIDKLKSKMHSLSRHEPPEQQKVENASRNQFLIENVYSSSKAQVNDKSTATSEKHSITSESGSVEKVLKVQEKLIKSSVFRNLLSQLATGPVELMGLQNRSSIQNDSVCNNNPTKSSSSKIEALEMLERKLTIMDKRNNPIPSKFKVLTNDGGHKQLNITIDLDDLENPTQLKLHRLTCNDTFWKEVELESKLSKILEAVTSEANCLNDDEVKKEMSFTQLGKLYVVAPVNQQQKIEKVDPTVVNSKAFPFKDNSKNVTSSTEEPSYYLFKSRLRPISSSSSELRVPIIKPKTHVARQRAPKYPLDDPPPVLKKLVFKKPKAGAKLKKSKNLEENGTRDDLLRLADVKRFLVDSKECLEEGNSSLVETAKSRAQLEKTLKDLELKSATVYEILIPVTSRSSDMLQSTDSPTRITEKGSETRREKRQRKKEEKRLKKLQLQKEKAERKEMKLKQALQDKCMCKDSQETNRTLKSNTSRSITSSKISFGSVSNRNSQTRRGFFHSKLCSGSKRPVSPSESKESIQSALSITSSKSSLKPIIIRQPSSKTSQKSLDRKVSINESKRYKLESSRPRGATPKKGSPPSSSTSVNNSLNARKVRSKGSTETLCKSCIGSIDSRTSVGGRKSQKGRSKTVSPKMVRSSSSTSLFLRTVQEESTRSGSQNTIFSKSVSSSNLRTMQTGLTDPIIIGPAVTVGTNSSRQRVETGINTSRSIRSYKLPKSRSASSIKSISSSNSRTVQTGLTDPIIIGPPAAEDTSPSKQTVETGINTSRSVRSYKLPKSRSASSIKSISSSNSRTVQTGLTDPIIIGPPAAEDTSPSKQTVETGINTSRGILSYISDKLPKSRSASSIKSISSSNSRTMQAGLTDPVIIGPPAVVGTSPSKQTVETGINTSRSSQSCNSDKLPRSRSACSIKSICSKTKQLKSSNVSIKVPTSKTKENKRNSDMYVSLSSSEHSIDRKNLKRKRSKREMAAATSKESIRRAKCNLKCAQNATELLQRPVMCNKESDCPCKCKTFIITTKALEKLIENYESQRGSPGKTIQGSKHSGSRIFKVKKLPKCPSSRLKVDRAKRDKDDSIGTTKSPTRIFGGMCGMFSRPTQTTYFVQVTPRLFFEGNTPKIKSGKSYEEASHSAEQVKCNSTLCDRYNESETDQQEKQTFKDEIKKLFFGDRSKIASSESACANRSLKETTKSPVAMREAENSSNWSFKPTSATGVKLGSQKVEIRRLNVETDNFDNETDSDLTEFELILSILSRFNNLPSAPYEITITPNTYKKDGKTSSNDHSQLDNLITAAHISLVKLLDANSNKTDRKSLDIALSTHLNFLNKQYKLFVQNESLNEKLVQRANSNDSYRLIQMCSDNNTNMADKAVSSMDLHRAPFTKKVCETTTPSSDFSLQSERDLLSKIKQLLDKDKTKYVDLATSMTEFNKDIKNANSNQNELTTDQSKLYQFLEPKTFLCQQSTHQPFNLPSVMPLNMNLSVPKSAQENVCRKLSQSTETSNTNILNKSVSTSLPDLSELRKNTNKASFIFATVDSGTQTCSENAKLPPQFYQQNSWIIAADFEEDAKKTNEFKKICPPGKDSNQMEATSKRHCRKHHDNVSNASGRSTKLSTYTQSSNIGSEKYVEKSKRESHNAYVPLKYNETAEAHTVQPLQPTLEKTVSKLTDSLHFNCPEEDKPITLLAHFQEYDMNFLKNEKQAQTLATACTQTKPKKKGNQDTHGLSHRQVETKSEKSLLNCKQTSKRNPFDGENSDDLKCSCNHHWGIQEQNSSSDTHSQISTESRSLEILQKVIGDSLSRCSEKSVYNMYNIPEPLNGRHLVINCTSVNSPELLQYKTNNTYTQELPESSRKINAFTITPATQDFVNDLPSYSKETKAHSTKHSECSNQETYSPTCSANAKESQDVFTVFHKTRKSQKNINVDNFNVLGLLSEYISSIVSSQDANPPTFLTYCKKATMDWNIAPNPPSKKLSLTKSNSAQAIVTHNRPVRPTPLLLNYKNKTNYLKSLQPAVLSWSQRCRKCHRVMSQQGEPPKMKRTNFVPRPLKRQQNMTNLSIYPRTPQTSSAPPALPKRMSRMPNSIPEELSDCNEKSYLAKTMQLLKDRQPRVFNRIEITGIEYPKIIRKSYFKPSEDVTENSSSKLEYRGPIDHATLFRRFEQPERDDPDIKDFLHEDQPNDGQSQDTITSSMSTSDHSSSTKLAISLEVPLSQLSRNKLLELKSISPKTIERKLANMFKKSETKQNTSQFSTQRGNMLKMLGIPESSSSGSIDLDKKSTYTNFRTPFASTCEGHTKEEVFLEKYSKLPVTTKNLNSHFSVNNTKNMTKYEKSNICFPIYKKNENEVETANCDGDDKNQLKWTLRFSLD